MCDAVFAGLPRLIALHRRLIATFEEVAGCTSSGRRLATQLLTYTSDLRSVYLPYARNWAVSAEHSLKGLEANPRCAKLVGAEGDGGGGGSPVQLRLGGAAEAAGVAGAAVAVRAASRAAAAAAEPRRGLAASFKRSTQTWTARRASGG